MIKSFFSPSFSPSFSVIVAVIVHRSHGSQHTLRRNAHPCPTPYPRQFSVDKCIGPYYYCY